MIQILLLGMNHEHIFESMKHFHPEKIILITSLQLNTLNKELYKKLRDKKINHEIYTINPFKLDFIPKMIAKYCQIFKKIKKENPKSEIQIGLTGGTNLMAISAAFSAFFLDTKANYLSKNSKQPYIWNLKNELSYLEFANS